MKIIELSFVTATTGIGRRLICFFLIIMLAAFPFAIYVSVAADAKATYSTLEEFDAQYPPVNEEALRQEGAKAAEEKFKPIKIGDEISVVPRAGNSVKGPYYGITSSGGVKVGGITISRVDLSDEDKVRFSGDTESAKKQFITNYVSTKKKEYLKEKSSKRSEVAKDIVAKSPDALLKIDGMLFSKVKIISADEISVTFEHSKGKEVLPYAQLESTSISKIKTNTTIKTAAGASYDGVKIMVKDSERVVFYDGSMKRTELKTSELSDESLKKLGLSKAAVGQVEGGNQNTKVENKSAGSAGMKGKTVALTGAQLKAFREESYKIRDLIDKNIIAAKDDLRGKKFQGYGVLQRMLEDGADGGKIMVEAWTRAPIIAFISKDALLSLDTRKRFTYIEGTITELKEIDGQYFILMIADKCESFDNW